MAWVGTRASYLLVGAIAIGCGGSENAPDEADATAANDDDDDGSGSAVDDGTSAGTSGVTEASVSDGDTSADDSITDTDATVSASDGSEGTDTNNDSTTGDELYCGLTDLEGGPWFELAHAGVPLGDGSLLTLECGGQGSLMFFIDTQIGGWIPDSDSVFFSVTVDVEGHVGPSGHFFQDTMFGEYIGCERFDGGGPLAGIAIIPPDDILDPTVLNGLPATIHIELLADGNPTFDANVELSVPADDPAIVECSGFG